MREVGAEEEGSKSPVTAGRIREDSSMILPQANDIFQSAKQIPIIEVARRYLPGLELRRSGSRWAARCPFHEDRDPSLYFFPDGGWRCFGCGAHGDAVDLVARVLNLRPLEAARTIARDFGLPVDDRPPSPEARKRAAEAARERELERAFREWCSRTYFGLCLLYRAISRVLVRDGWERYAELAHVEVYVEYLLDVLQYGTDDERLELFLAGEADKWLL